MAPTPASSLPDLQVARGFAEPLRGEVARLYDAAFGAKVGLAIPDAGARLRLLASAFDPRHAFVALAGARVLGVAGFATADGALTAGLDAARLRAHLGLRGALRAMLVLPLFERARQPGELLMDGIAVAPEARGGGIGTRLLQRLQQFAAEEGYRQLRLDVIDTNPAARRLYERLGFVATRTTSWRPLRRLLGFSGATTLAYAVPPR